MEPLRRHKKYKNRLPEETIALIQQILRDKLQIGVYERAFQERNGLFFSCRLLLDDGKDMRSLNIGTNGKGMTESYSRASAYGELMERIQNGIILRLPQNEVVPPYYMYSCDEQNSNDDNLLRDSIDKYVFSCDNAQLYELVKGHTHQYIPYYDVSGKQVVNLPMDIIYNSISTNGLCAGNTPKEAIIEGLSEILERYVIRRIYMDGLTLSNIPRVFFEGNEILKRIEELEQREQYKINIVDCSCGDGIPAVGIIVKTEDESEYQFHMGVDPSPITALERSLTELFQGRNAIKFKQYEPEVQSRIGADTLLTETEMEKTYCASTGSFPQTLFAETPSWEFCGFDSRWGLSDDSDLTLMTELIRKLGFKLYVRDNSVLGFPAYSLYVPGMTELYNTLSLEHFRNTYQKIYVPTESAYTELVKHFQLQSRTKTIAQSELCHIFHQE